MKRLFQRFKDSWKKKELDPEIEVNFEKGDITALIIAAFITIIPVVLLLLGGVYLVIHLLFLR